MIFARDIKGWNRILVMVWLLANTLLLSLYSDELFELIMNGNIVDRIESKEELFTKVSWKSSKIYMADLGIVDLITTGYANNDLMAKQFLSRSEIAFNIDIMRDEELKCQILKDVVYDNKVMIANKLTTYYMLRDGQDRYPEIFIDFVEGIDYYISKPEQSYRAYYSMIIREFIPDHFILEFNTM